MAKLNTTKQLIRSNSALRGLSIATDLALFPGLGISIIALIGFLANLASSQTSGAFVAGIFLGLGSTLVFFAVIGKILTSATAAIIEELREE
jgi:hypothetical protein